MFHLPMLPLPQGRSNKQPPANPHHSPKNDDTVNKANLPNNMDYFVEPFKVKLHVNPILVLPSPRQVIHYKIAFTQTNSTQNSS